jgi:hypothetical protein
MYTLKKSSIDGFNAFLKSQQALPGKANMTLVYFSNDVRTLFKSKNIKAVEELTDSTYRPQGGTALFDAIGKTTIEISKDIDEKRIKADRVLCVILTDGEENSSQEFKDKSKIKDLIEIQRGKSWEYIFLAANQDAFAEASSYGISTSNSLNFTANDADNTKLYRKMSKAATMYRSATRSFASDGSSLYDRDMSSIMEDADLEDKAENKD